MKTIAVIGEKGGSSKTTLAQGLAVAAARSGLATAILDLDATSNTVDWYAARPQGDGLACRSVQHGELPRVVQALEEAGAEFVVLDTAGHNSVAALAAARCADLVLIPCKKQKFEVKTLGTNADTVALAKNKPPAYIVPVRHSWNTKNPSEGLRPIAEHFGLNIAPVGLAQRTIYADAPGFNMTPQELEPESAAAAEIQALFEFVRSLTNSQTQPEQRKTAQ